MAYSMKNGNGGAVIIPPTPIGTITGHSLVHRDLNKRQLAVLAANVVDGIVLFIPTQKQLADIFGVSVKYVEVARGLTPLRRAAILKGLDETSFAELSPPRQLALKMAIKPEITNTELENLVRRLAWTGSLMPRLRSSMLR
jgi:hypothetical protein